MKVSLSDGEWKLMYKLWEEPSRTIAQLTAALQPETGWRARGPSLTTAAPPGITRPLWPKKTPPGPRPAAFWTRSTAAGWA